MKEGMNEKVKKWMNNIKVRWAASDNFIYKFNVFSWSPYVWVYLHLLSCIIKFLEGEDWLLVFWDKFLWSSPQYSLRQW